MVESPIAAGAPAEEGVIPFNAESEKIQLPGAEEARGEKPPGIAERHEAEEMDTITMRPVPTAPESPAPISEGSAPGEQTSDAVAEDTQPLEAASASETDIPQITEVPGVSANPEPESHEPPPAESPPEPVASAPALASGEASASDEDSAIDFVAAAAGPGPDAESTSMAEAGIESIPSPETSDTDPGLGTPITDADTQELSQTGGEFNQSTQRR